MSANDTGSAPAGVVNDSTNIPDSLRMLTTDDQATASARAQTPMKSKRVVKPSKKSAHSENAISTPKSSKSKTGKSKKSTAKKTVNAKTQSAKKAITPSAKKKKLADFQSKITSSQQQLEKLKKEKSRQSLRLKKQEIDEQRNRFPVRDELISQVDPDGGAPLMLPVPWQKIDERLPETMVEDALGTWDFLCTFNKSLGIQTIAWDDFVDLLAYNLSPSLAFYDIFSSPLRLILQDQSLAHKLSDSLSVPGFENDFGRLGKRSIIKMLPHRLRDDLVDPLRLDAVIGAVLLGLEPVQSVRRALRDVQNLDSKFSLTVEFESFWKSVYCVAERLQGNSLFVLSLSDKLVALKALCSACLETKRLSSLLAQNSVERAERLNEIAKSERERKKKEKESSANKRAEALLIWQRLNGEDKIDDQSSKKKKKKSECSAETLQSLVDELVVLQGYGIDTIVPDPEIIMIDEETEVDEDTESVDRDRRVSAKQRNALAERKRLREEYQSRGIWQEQAQEKIEYALQTNSDRDLKAAIRASERANLKGSGESGVFIANCLRPIYKVLFERESKAAEEKLLSEKERAMQDCFVATDPIGSDRNGSLYWLFAGDENKLFVQERRKVGIPAELSLDSEDPALKCLLAFRPSQYSARWKVYSCASELTCLCEALDDRGVRERALKSAILARFDLGEAVHYSTTGSEFIGCKVERKFGKKSIVGTIVSWLPPTDEDVALWHVLHQDGDEEDLEKHEIDGFLVNNALAAGGDNSEELPIPKLARLAGGIVRSSKADRCTGILAFQQELFRFAAALYEPLKLRGRALTREDKKILENKIRDCESLDSVRSLILELEEIVRAVQIVEDNHDEDIQAAVEAEERKHMISEGWIFDAEKCSFIGKRVRRFFPNFGKSDGTVIAFVNEDGGNCLYRIQHDDGDREDIEEIQFKTAIAAFDDDLQEPDGEADMEIDQDQLVAEDVGDANEEEGSHDEDGNIEEEEAAGNADRLWASSESRSRWFAAVADCQSFSELAIATAVLEKHSYQFLEYSVESSFPLMLLQISASNNSNRESRGVHSILSPRKAKKSASDQIRHQARMIDFYDSDEDRRGNGRTMRQAAQRVS